MPFLIRGRSGDTTGRRTHAPSLLLLALTVSIVGACMVRDSAAQPNPLRVIENAVDDAKSKLKGKGKGGVKKDAIKPGVVQKKAQPAIDKKKRDLTGIPKQPGKKAVDTLPKGPRDKGIPRTRDDLGKDAQRAKTKDGLGKDGKSAKTKGALSKDAKSAKSKDGLGKDAMSAKSKDGPGNDAKKAADGKARDGKGKDAQIKSARVGDAKAKLSKDGKSDIGKGKLATRPPHVARMAPVQRRTFETNHRRILAAARNRIPHRPLPGETGFTGVPPTTETRYVATEMVFQAGPNVTPEQIQALAQKRGVTVVGSQPMGLTGGTLYHIRVTDSRRVSDEVRAWETQRVGVAQPNYVYRTQQDPIEPSALGEPAQAAGDPAQYVIEKLRLAEIHRRAKGANVLVAVIDSQIDLQHPDLAGQIAEQFDAVGGATTPHPHGTGMTGAIAAHRKLLGIAPGVRILAVRSFSQDAKQSPQATTRHIIPGLDWAIGKGARVINMSFAGPHDPMLSLAMKRAYERGVVLIAASGNAGAKSPPLYPAADRHVIAVTATDADDKLMAAAVRGAHVAVSAPGVDIMVPAPDNAYNLTTGTSVAAAHVSGIAALLLERHPTATVQMIHEVLTSSARRLGTQVRDDQFGWGLVDPAAALEELDERMAGGAVASAAPAQPAVQQSARPAVQPVSLPATEAVPLPPRRPPLRPAQQKGNTPMQISPLPATVR
jgi:subtilisin family serine protease